MARARFVGGFCIFAIFTTLFALAYWPVATSCYGVSDDYWLLHEALPETGFTAMWNHKIAIGRPVGGVLQHCAFSHLNCIAELSILRSLAIVFLGLLAAVFYGSLVLAGWKRMPAFLCSLAAFTLPPFQVYVAWATECFQPLAAVLAAAAWFVAEKFYRETRPLARAPLAVASVVLLLLALLIYQPVAMLFWIFAAIAVFKPGTVIDTKATIRRLSCYMLVFGSAAAVFMVIWRTCLILLPHLVLSQARRNLTSNLLEKLTWFVQQPLTDALNLAYLVPSAQVAAAVAFFGLVGLLLYFGGSLQNRLLQLALAVALIPLTYLPNLVAAENWGTYRTKSALTVLIAVYVLFALAGYLAKLPESFRHPLLISILGALAPVCLFLASTQVRDYFVVPQQLELKFVREHVASHFDKIDAIKRKYLNPRNEGLAPLTRYDEFGILSVLQYQAKKPMLLLLLREANQQRVAVKTSKTLQ